jgi:hypothetical protein
MSDERGGYGIAAKAAIAAVAALAVGVGGYYIMQASSETKSKGGSRHEEAKVKEQVNVSEQSKSLFHTHAEPVVILTRRIFIRVFISIMMLASPSPPTFLEASSSLASPLKKKSEEKKADIVPDENEVCTSSVLFTDILMG